MKPKEVARLLELIKYFTFTNRKGLSEPGARIILTSKADVGKTEAIEEKEIELPSRIFNIESLVIDYGAEYSSSRQSKEIKIYFGKKPTEGPVIGSGPDREYKITTDPDGLMTPAITQEYTKGGNSFTRYIFPSDQDGTYLHSYAKYNDWYQTTLKDIDESYSRQLSITILVESSSTTGFESFLNESLTDWRSRFTTDTNNAKSGNFNWFSLYDPKIYEKELSFEDRISILNYMVYSLSWPFIFDGVPGVNGVDEYELFIALITSTSKEDGEKLYNYMFEVDSLTGNTNLDIYKEKLPEKLYDVVIKTIIKFFYSTKTLAQFKAEFRDYLLYPIGFYEKLGSRLTFNINTQEYDDETGPYRLGVKYDTSAFVDVDTGNLKIKVNSAYRYKENYGLNRIEYEKFTFIGQNEEWNFDEILYVTSFLSNQKLDGIDIPNGSVMPIPAFALSWLVEKNEDTEDIIDLLEEGATLAGIFFPVLDIFIGVEAIYSIKSIYNILGLGFTLIGNTLSAGLKNQIELYDEYKSTSLGYTYTEGKDFLETYYLLSAIYGGISLKNAIKEAKTIEDKAKLLLDFETLLGAKAIVDDFNTFMDLKYPSEPNILKNEMNQLQIDYNSLKYLKNVK